MLLRLNLQFFSGEKTEEATPKKRADSREKGQVAKSQDVNTAINLLVSFSTLFMVSTIFYKSIVNVFTQTYTSYMEMPINADTVTLILIDILQDLAMPIGLLFIAIMVGGIAGNLLQFGFLFSPEAIQMKLSKINPLEGAKRIFSMRSIVELIKSILKVSIIGIVATIVIWSNKHLMLRLVNQSLSDVLIAVAKLSWQIGIYSAGALLVIALLDYLYQKYDFEKSIRMSKQDIQDEYKKTEGDPLIKSKIKQKQREMAMRRMMQDVPKADVVITNPTHFAIALKYDGENMAAPIVVAKGIDFVAQRIKEIALQHDVAMIENRPLARALYDQAEIGQPIPEQFFKAVAEILAYVYRLQRKI